MKIYRDFKIVFIGALGLMFLASATTACIPNPRFVELQDGLELKVPALTIIILKGKMKAPDVVSVHDEQGNEFEYVSITKGYTRYEDQRNLIQRMNNEPPYGGTPVFEETWTQVYIDDAKAKVDYPITLLWRVNEDSAFYNIQVTYTEMQRGGC